MTFTTAGARDCARFPREPQQPCSWAFSSRKENRSAATGRRVDEQNRVWGRGKFEPRCLVHDFLPGRRERRIGYERRHTWYGELTHRRDSFAVRALGSAHETKY